MSSPSRAAPCFENQPRVIFRTIVWPGFKNASGLFFRYLRAVSAGRAWRGPGRRTGCTNHPGVANHIPQKGGNRKAACTPIPGLAAGRLVGAWSRWIASYLSRRPGGFRIGRPPFGGAFPGKPPGRRSSPPGTAGGDVWVVPGPPNPFLSTPCLLGGEPLLLLIRGLYERSTEGKE